MCLRDFKVGNSGNFENLTSHGFPLDPPLSPEPLLSTLLGLLHARHLHLHDGVEALPGELRNRVVEVDDAPVVGQGGPEQLQFGDRPELWDLFMS